LNCQTSAKIIKKGQTMSIIDKDEQGYFLVDPLFKEFLKKYKSFYSEKL